MVDLLSRLKNPVALAGIFLFFLLVVVALQWHSGAYYSEFADNPDEPSHYVTGLMVGDYLSQLAPTGPMEYAKRYYGHYPRVALGHWPPLFYVVEGIWTILFSSSRVSVVMLMAFLTALVAFGVCLVVRRAFTAWAGVATGVFLISLPLFQRISRSVNPEMLLALFMLGAVLCYGRYLDSNEGKYSVAFGAMAMLAILTKGTGFVLALVPPISILLARRIRFARQPSFWAPAIIAALLAVPWYFVAPGAWHSLAISGGAVYWYYPWHQLLLWTPMTLVDVAGVPVILLAAAGIFVRVLHPWWTAKGISGTWVALFSLVASYWLFRAAVPPACPPKNWTSFLGPLVIFACAGGSVLLAIAARPLHALSPRWKAGIVAMLVMLSITLHTRQVSALPQHGFSEVAADMFSQPSEMGPAEVLLVSSDGHGEGMMVAEVAMRDKRPGRIVLRGTKSLAKSGWFGEDKQLVYSSAEQMAAFLASIPVELVVLDVTPTVSSEEGRLLREAVEGRPELWETVASYPRKTLPDDTGRRLIVYRLKGPEGRPRSRIHIDLRDRIGGTIEIE